ncbi:MAG: Protein of unknown function (DUF2721) [Candidatus Frackibacter sp. T328-2]|nr:MAG: Protein of unknown function (DUF2721) [Candidatus Frackibacter sp. T328-2]
MHIVSKITTPAFLFSTISLLMSAYGVRFTKICQVARNLSSEIRDTDLPKKKNFKKQLLIFTKRLGYIRYLQLFAVVSLFFSTLSMFFLLFGKIDFGNITFILAVLFFLVSLVTSLIEIYYSMKALDINLEI